MTDESGLRPTLLAPKHQESGYCRHLPCTPERNYLPMKSPLPISTPLWRRIA